MKKTDKKVETYIGDVEFELTTPLIVAGKEFTKLKFREPKVEDLEKVTHLGSELEQTITIIANIGGFTIEEVRKFPSQLYMRIQERIRPFLF